MFRMLIQTHSKRTTSLIKHIFKEIGRLNLFNLDNHYSSYRHQTRSIRRRQIAHNRQKLPEISSEDFQEETTGISILVVNLDNSPIFSLVSLKKLLPIKHRWLTTYA